MAIKPSEEWTNTTPPSTKYPWGSSKEDSAPGTHDGTPIDKNFVDDVWGLLQAILTAGNITPNGLPDSVEHSDYLDALKAVFAMGVNLGTAAAHDVGTAPGEIPLNSQLKSAAQHETGTGPDEIPLNSDLGTAANYNVGSAASNVPLNSNLGSASKYNVGTGTNQIPLKQQLGSAAFYAVGSSGSQLTTNTRAIALARAYGKIPGVTITKTDVTATGKSSVSASAPGGYRYLSHGTDSYAFRVYSINGPGTSVTLRSRSKAGTCTATFVWIRFS